MWILERKMSLIVILEVLIKFIRLLYLGLPPYMDTLVRYLMMVQRATEAGCYVVHRYG
jgi:hypothetical protein